MDSSNDAFDRLCQQVFAIDQSSSPPTTASPIPLTPTPTTSAEEIALSVLSRAQVYELPSTFTFPPSYSSALPQDKQCYRIPLESIEGDLNLRHKVHSILVQTIDPSVLLELPFDRNLSGYSTKTRTEVIEAPLETAVVLDMEGLSETKTTAATATGDAGTGAEGAESGPIEKEDRTMLLVPVQTWLWMVGRIRYWRQESHRVKAAQREVLLDKLLQERWRPCRPLSGSFTSLSAGASSPSCTPPNKSTSAIISSPPTTAGHLVQPVMPASLPSPASSVVSSPNVSPRSSTVPTAMEGAVAAPLLQTRHSCMKQAFQEHQLDTFVQFLSLYGDEPSATSLLRGLFDLIRQQLGQPRVLSWTFDRANLTEQKPEVTVAFLNLIAGLGLELVDWTREDQQQFTPPPPPPSAQSQTTLSSLSGSNVTAVASAATDSTEHSNSASATSTTTTTTDLTWTFGPRMDDKRLEYWVHHLQQSNLPVLQMDDQSLLPSTHGSGQHSSSPQTKKNPLPLSIQKRFLRDQKTIPAVTIQYLSPPPTSSTTTTPAPTSTTTTVSTTTTTTARDRSLVLMASAYSMPMVGTSESTQSSQPSLFVDRVRKDVKDLARWATTCGGRLDWIWSWLFSSFQKNRSTSHRTTRPNDENV